MTASTRPSIDVVVPVLGETEDLDATLRSLAAQSGAGAGYAMRVIVAAAPDAQAALAGATAGEHPLHAISSAADTRGALLEEAIAAGDSELIAVLCPGETLSTGAVAALVRELQQHKEADLACVRSLSADTTLDPPYTPPGDADWESSTMVRNVRLAWWTARRSLRGVAVRRSALPARFDPSPVWRDADRRAVLEVQTANPLVVFCADEAVSFTYADEHQARRFQGAFDPEWLLDPIARSWPAWLDELEGPDGIDRFVQAVALSAIAIRFSTNADNLNKRIVLGEDLQTFLDACAVVLGSIDDKLIVNPDSRAYTGIDTGLALTLYLVKHSGRTVAYAVEPAAGGNGVAALTIDGHLLELPEDQTVKIMLIDWDEGRRELIVDGRVRGFAWLAGTGYSVRAKTIKRQGGAPKVVRHAMEHRDWYALTKYFGVAATKEWAFRVRIPVDADSELVDLSFTCDADPKKHMPLQFSGHFCRIARHPRRSWWAFGDHFMYHRLNHIVIQRRTATRMLANEILLLGSLLHGSRLQHRHAYNRAAFFKRLAYWLTRPFFAGKARWFFVDKVYKAGDSSEYLFRYASAQSDGIVKDYAINARSADYARLRSDGYKPVKAGSLRHLLAFLHADLVFASNSTVTSLNGLKSWRSAPYRTFLRFDTVCTQHGLSIQDVAVAQNRLIDNTRLYLLASHVELENLRRPVYAYDDYPQALQLTGMPRYDGLVSDDRRQILIHPTWRMQFAMPVATHEGEERPYNPSFKESPYFRTYSSLITNEKLIECAKETGYAIKYVLHPIASAQIDDFPRNGYVEILGAAGKLDYEAVLTQSSLMVTDYSGVQFDFAYMRKPVVYYHPSELPPHYEVSSFAYDTMGFGEICPDEAALVDTLCDYMRAECRMKDEYVERVDSFFAFDDRNNCERSYRAALDYMRHRNERR